MFVRSNGSSAQDRAPKVENFDYQYTACLRLRRRRKADHRKTPRRAPSTAAIASRRDAAANRTARKLSRALVREDRFRSAPDGVLRSSASL
jgi:hypothetical protein